MPMFTTSVMAGICTQLLGIGQHGVQRGVHLDLLTSL